jgi:hypothetical protein
MIFTFILVNFFFFETLSKPTSIDIDELQMEVIELQTNDLLKNAFNPSDLGIQQTLLDCGFTYHSFACSQKNCGNICA